MTAPVEPGIGVPLWIANDLAKHSGNAHRVLNYFAVQGREGVIGKGDCKITPLDVPGGGVFMNPGVVAAVNQSPGTGGIEMYVGRRTERVQVPVPATGSGSGRVDMLAFVFKDPTQSGTDWGDPDDVVNGPYDGPERIDNIAQYLSDPSQALGVKHLHDLGLGWTGYPLALLNIPPATGTITQNMILPLRGLAHSRQDVYEETNVSSGDTLSPSHPAWGAFPDLLDFTIPVPDWATNATVRFSADGVVGGDGPFLVRFRVRAFQGTTPIWTSPEWDWHVPWELPDNLRLPFNWSGPAIPAVVLPAWRGNTYTWQLQARWVSGASNSHVSFQDGSRLTARINWFERAE